MEGETIRHAFDRKAFFKSHTPAYVMAVVACIFNLTLSFFAIETNTWDDWLFVVKNGLPLLTLYIYFYTFLNSWFIGKRSIIITSPGCVVYRKRRGGLTMVYDILAASMGGHERVMYTVYIIDQVNKLNYRDRRPMTVKGRISAVRVYEDGQTAHDRRVCRRVVIPQYYTDTQVLISTLIDIGGIPAKESPVQQGFPSRLEF